MSKILLITPPFVQPNTAYPATPYLKGYLRSEGIDAEQLDLSIELLNSIFTRGFITQVFDNTSSDINHIEDGNIQRIYDIRSRYIATIETVMSFLSGKDSTLASLICMPDFIPQSARFEYAADLEDTFGTMGTQDCAKHICTLFLQDISDFIRATVSPYFEIIKYAEGLSISVPEFSMLEESLQQPRNIIEELMIEILETHINQHNPAFVGFTIPFPGNLMSALRCAQHLKQTKPEITILAGGGFPSTELRNMTDKGIFKYFDYVLLDGGEKSIKNIINGNKATNCYTIEGYIPALADNSDSISHLERGCPDFSGLPFNKYFSLCEVSNPMHRLWSDGMWNKMTIAHGCYWAKCAFCDTSLDYVKCYNGVSATQFVDWMESVAKQTGSNGFHFTDEAAPPKLLKEISLELIKRNLNFSWWTNIRFESAFTEDLCHLMATAGCIAVSGGLEVASDRLLKMIDKGITIETATISMRNFYYSGIMVHAYLMYGLPTQTLQETVDALEVVRQMFQADLIDSAFWHRYAMTAHSPSGLNPEKFGIRRKNNKLNSFANNEIEFVEQRNYNIEMVGDALHDSLANYMTGGGVERRADNWFEGKAPRTKVEKTLITDHLIKPDSSRLFKEHARLIWVGASLPIPQDEGFILFNTSAEQKVIKFPEADAEFMIKLIELCSDLDQVVTLDDARNLYMKDSEQSFLNFYHSKRWDRVRALGLLQI